MKNSTLIAIFRLLKPQEIPLLVQLAHTPLLKLPNRHTDTVQLLEYLVPFAPNFEHATHLDKPYVAQRLYGHRAQPETELRKAMSNLVGMVKKFILAQQLLHHTDASNGEMLQQIRSDMELLKWLSARSGPSSPNTAKKKTGKKAQPDKARLLLRQQYQTVKDATTVLLPPIAQFDQRNYSEWLLTAFWREFEMFDYFGLQRAKEEQEAHLLMALEQLDLFYYQLKMSLTVHLQINAAVFTSAAPKAQAHIDHAGHLVQEPPAYLRDEPNLAVYIAAFQMMRDMDSGDSQYQLLEDLLQSEQLSLPYLVKQNLRHIQNTYCAIMYNRTREQIYLQRRFDLQKIDLEHELQHSRGNIAAMRLSGTVSNALFLGAANFEWVAALLERFPNGQGITTTDTPKEVYKVNRAHLLFYQGAYREASNELIGYDWYSRINDAQTLLLAIRIDLKTQFELGHYESDYLLRVLDTAEKRITRLSGLDAQLSAMTLNFLRVFRQIDGAKAKGKLFYGQDDWESKVLEWQTFVQEKPVAEKNWLLAQLEHLQNK